MYVCIVHVHIYVVGNQKLVFKFVWPKTDGRLSYREIRGHLPKCHAYRDAIDASTGCEVLHAGHFSSVLLFVSYNSLL